MAWDPPARFYSKVEIERETLVEYPSGASLWANGVVFTYTPTLEYVVEALSDGSYDLHTTDSSTRAYTDTTATDSSTYRYRVRTLDGDTGGAWSVWRTTVGSEAAQTVSSVPFNLDVIRTADGTAATLSWDAVPRDVTKYMLRREEMVLRANQIQPSWTETKSFDVVATGTGDVPSTYTDQGIDEDTTYRYRVAAVDPAGQGPFSDPVETAGHQDPTSVVDRTGLFTTPSLEGYSPGLNATGDAQGYEIKISAPSSAWPIRVEVHEGRSVRLSDAGTATSCSNLEEDLTVTKATAKFWLYACHAGELTTLQLRRDGDRALLAEYRVHTKSSKTPPPTPSGPGAIGTPSADDPLGIEPIIEEIMSNAGIDYDMGLLKNFLVVAGAVGVAAIRIKDAGGVVLWQANLKDSITVSAQALRIDDLSGLDLLAYEGERVFIHMDYPELVRNLAKVPGGPVGAQIGLMCFALVAGSLMMRGRYRGIMAIAGAVGAGLILPIMGVGGAGAQLVGGVTLVLGLAFAFLWQRMSR